MSLRFALTIPDLRLCHSIGTRDGSIIATIFADGVHAGAAEVQDPGLFGESLGRRQGSGIEQGNVGTVLRIAHRFIADGLKAGVARGVGEGEIRNRRAQSTARGAQPRRTA